MRSRLSDRLLDAAAKIKFTPGQRLLLRIRSILAALTHFRLGPITELALFTELGPFDGPENTDPTVQILLTCHSQPASIGLIDPIAQHLGRSC